MCNLQSCDLSVVVPVYNEIEVIELYIILGIIGEYIAKIHIETKKRPRYIIDKIERKEEKF